MARALSRRTLLQAALLATAAPAVTCAAGGRAAAATLPAPSAWALRPFELKDVRLGQGVFATKRQLMLDHGRGYDVNRL
ncbi:hypothetical protein, partial [Streptomyces resistomycificus]